MFDGPVDTLWIESMNSVMDDNKVLTLINGDRISMPEQVTDSLPETVFEVDFSLASSVKRYVVLLPQVSLLFEGENLAQASPATVSRCGMVYNDYTDLGWTPYVQSWLDKRHKVPQSSSREWDQKCSVVLFTLICLLWQAEVEHLKQMFDKFIEKVINFKKANCKELVTITELNGVMSLCRLYDAMATADNGVRR